MRRGVAAVQLAGGPAGQQGAGGLARSLSGQSGLEKGGREGGSERAGEVRRGSTRRGGGEGLGGLVVGTVQLASVAQVIAPKTACAVN